MGDRKHRTPGVGRALEAGCVCTCPAGVPGLRHLWWRPSTDIRAPTGFHQHPHADTNTIPDGHACAHIHPRTDGDADNYTVPDGHSYAHIHSLPDSDADSYTIPNGHSYAHIHSLPGGDALVHSHGCTYCNTRTHSHAYPRH